MCTFACALRLVHAYIPTGYWSICMYIHTYTYIHICKYACRHLCTCIFIYANIDICVDLCIHMQIYIYMQYLYIHIYRYWFTNVCKYVVGILAKNTNRFRYIHIYLHQCIRTYLFIFTFIQLCRTWVHIFRYIYLHVYSYEALSLWNVSCWSNLGFKSRMSAWVPDVLREVRLWSSSAPGCPWVLILGAGLVLGASCFCCGFFWASLVFSQRCRRFLSQLLHLILVTWQPVPTLDLRGRLAEYRRDSWWVSLLTQPWKVSLFF